MLASRLRLAALATALLLPLGSHAQGDGLGLKLQRSIGGTPGASGGELPVFIYADRLEGIPGKESAAEGNAELRKGNLSIQADSLRYFEENEDVDARGNVRVERSGDVITGPSLKYRVKDATGVFEQPEYILAPRLKPNRLPVSGHGRAQAIEFLGEDQFKLKDGTFTTCKPGSEDWYLEASELDLDYNREVGTARNATLRFKDVTLFKVPFSFEFPLNNERKSGLLPPSFGSTGKSGAEATLPYYFNLAPNYDLTVTPRYMQKRGFQIGSQFRYLQPHYTGEIRAEVLPNDRTADRTRSALTLLHSYNLDGRILGGLNINAVSDDNYFRDLSSRINITSQTTLPREGFLAYNGAWWDTGTYIAAARVQRYQVLQDPLNPIVTPYSRAPQLTLTALRQNIAGFDFASNAEYVDFGHPALVTGKRLTVYPSVSFPLLMPGAFLTPKIGVHETHYLLGNVAPGVPDTINRLLPIMSVDGGLVFERETELRGQSFIQTLEPRAYYLRIPYRGQGQIPLFDTGLADFNYAQIFSENMFVGGDRINDANQLTLALSSRLLLPSTGQEVIRATIGQRYYFTNQQVTLNPTDVPRTYHVSNWLGSLSGRIAPRWTAEVATEYNARDNRTERLTLTARYQPEPLKTLNLSYRYLSTEVAQINQLAQTNLLGIAIAQPSQIKQIDLSAQWPLGRGWYGVGRFNYSLPDRRVVEGLGGFEYNADCWIGRVVVQRFALTTDQTTTALFFQLELNGLSRIGSNPLEALKRNIPGYQRLDVPAPDSNRPDRPFDFNN